MEGSIVLWFIMVFLAILLAFAIIYHVIASTPARKSSAPAPAKKSSTSHFIRENSVSGYLMVDGKKIQTFNPGTLSLDDLVEITFYNNFNSPIKITDIELNGISIFSFTEAGTPYRNQADYAIQVLKQTANQGSIPRSLVREVEQIILDVDALNEHIKAKRIKQKQTATADDFIWVG